VGDVLLRPARRSDARAVSGLLADALAVGDAGWAAVVPDRAERHAALQALLRVVVADTGAHARVTEVEGEVLGAALWQPPGRYPMTPWRTSCSRASTGRGRWRS